MRPTAKQSLVLSSCRQYMANDNFSAFRCPAKKGEDGGCTVLSSTCNVGPLRTRTERLIDRSEVQPWPHRCPRRRRLCIQSRSDNPLTCGRWHTSNED